MMMLLNRKNLAIALVTLAFIFSGVSAAHAQNDINDHGLISVDFPGGTVAEYVAALAKAAGSVNVLVSPEAAKASMPAVKLTKVTVSAAIDLVEGTRTDKGDPTVYLDVDHLKQYAGREQQTYRINAEIPGRNTRSQIIERIQSRVWSIAHLIKDGVFDSKLVLDAVEMAIDITKSTTEVDMRFHEATGLLIASGSSTQLDAIESVLSELMRSSQMKSYKSQSKLESDLERFKNELNIASDLSNESAVKQAQLEDENKALRLELETQMVRFAETRRMLDERQTILHDTTSQLREVQAALDRAQRQLLADDDKSGNKDY